MVTISQAILCSLIVGVLYLACSTRSKAKDNPLRPKAVPAVIPIPFIGHALSLLIWRNQYYTKISQRWKNLPIVSVRMFGGSVYVVGSPDLIYSVQRQPKSLSFWFFEAQYQVKFSGMCKKTEAVVMRGLAPDSHEDSPVIDGLKATRLDLSPQGGLDDMVQIAAEAINRQLEEQQRKKKTAVDLYGWVRHEVTIVTTEAKRYMVRRIRIEIPRWNPRSGTLRPHCPYRSSHVQGFHGVNHVAWPSATLAKLFAAKGIAGRETVVKAFNQYYASNSHVNASQLVKLRYEAIKDNHYEDDVARSDCMNGLALLQNSAPVAFWTIFHTYSDPVILEVIRSQVEKITTFKLATGNQPERRTIHVSRFNEAPILSSIIQETLRYRARGAGPRMVMEDVFLSDDEHQYHLEKGSVLMIAHNAMHMKANLWGETANTFIADRFVPGKKIPVNAFRGFGGGVNMCPGKGFAMAEISCLLAMTVMRFDMKPVDGRWVEPGQSMSNMAMENPPPVRKTMIELVPKVGCGDVAWEFAM